VSCSFIEPKQSIDASGDEGELDHRYLRTALRICVPLYSLSFLAMDGSVGLAMVGISTDDFPCITTDCPNRVTLALLF